MQILRIVRNKACGVACPGEGWAACRYVHGASVDDPIIWYEGPTVTATSRRHLFADHQGSIVGITNGTGALLAIDRYDDWGVPDATNLGRFQYSRGTRLSGGQASPETQAWIPELGMYHYKARIYSPTLGRFLQTDPIGYQDQMNLYAYVGNDPLNGRDPTGMCEAGSTPEECVVTARSYGLLRTAAFLTATADSVGLDLYRPVFRNAGRAAVCSFAEGVELAGDIGTDVGLVVAGVGGVVGAFGGARGGPAGSAAGGLAGAAPGLHGAGQSSLVATAAELVQDLAVSQDMNDFRRAFTKAGVNAGGGHMARRLTGLGRRGGILSAEEQAAVNEMTDNIASTIAGQFVSLDEAGQCNQVSF